MAAEGADWEGACPPRTLLAAETEKSFPWRAWRPALMRLLPPRQLARMLSDATRIALLRTRCLVVVHLDKSLVLRVLAVLLARPRVVRELAQAVLALERPRHHSLLVVQSDSGADS